MKIKIYILLIVNVFLTVEIFAQSNIKTFIPSKDNTLYSESNNSNGNGDYFFAGNTSGKNSRRALISFPLNIPIVPENKLMIEKVTIKLNANKSIGGTQAFKMHRLLKDWGESTSNANSQEGSGATPITGDATWNYANFSTLPWKTKGGDFETLPSANFTISNIGEQTISSTGLLDDVNFWLSNPDKNFGWILIGDESKSATTYRFDSRENKIDLGPKLIINYSIITNLDNENEEDLIKIWYDPKSSSIQFTKEVNQSEIEIMDTSGKIMGKSDSNMISTNLLPSGLYFVKAVYEGKFIQNKFYIP